MLPQFFKIVFRALVLAVAMPLAMQAVPGSGLSAQATDFPRPAEIEPDIAFWRMMFTEVDSKHAVLHDNRHLGVIYERFRLPGEGTRAKRRASEKARKEYRGILNKLATGKRSGLSAKEKRVLALWPDTVTNAELKEAARHLRLQQGLSNRFKEGLIRSGRWEDHILKHLRQAGVPDALASLPHVESSYNPKAYSHVGASGLWQFTRSTGRRFMQVDHIVDERRDPYRASESAAELLKYNYSILKSWPLAITAYNHGVSGMRRAVRTTGTTDIEVILRKYKGRAFGFASRNFYVAFLAANEVASDPEKYFGKLTKDRPRQDLIVEVPDYVPAKVLARSFNVSRKKLQEYNPALMDSVWSGMKHVPRGYPLRLPVSAGSAQQLVASIPAKQRFARQTPDLEHKVRRGESLSAIAARYGTTVSKLMAVNNLKSRHRIRAGQILNLPFNGAAPLSIADTSTYVVQRGDTISKIARRAGMSQRELLAMNQLTNSNRIYPGQTLLLQAPVKPVARPSSEAVAEAKEPASSSQAPASQAPEAAQPQPAAEPPQVIVEQAPDGVLAAVAPNEESAAQDAAELDVDQGADAALRADPADYLVSANGTIEIQAEETLGHYADWLRIRTQRLRDINRYEFRKPAVIGKRLKLDFSQVDKKQFTEQRVAYHRDLQETFFARYRIADTRVHKFRRGDSLFVLSLRKYKVPVWLLRQYNPDLNLDRIKPGTSIVFPQIERVQAGGDSPALARN